MDKPKDHTSPTVETLRKLIHQPKDKNTKEFYSDTGMSQEFLGKHLPRPLLPVLDLPRFVITKTEYIDPNFKTVRHVDSAWKVPFRNSDLYLLVLLEAQAHVDWWMAARTHSATAFAYQHAIKSDKEVQRSRQLPLVLPIVVYVGTEPWNAPTSLEELLPEEAASVLPFASGSKFLLVSEAEEARALERVDTPRAAALKLRYAQDRREFREALAAAKELLPEDSPSRRALVKWVRSSMFDAGAKEEDMAELRELEDLGRPAVDSFWAAEKRQALREGLEQGREQGREQGIEQGREQGLQQGIKRGREEGLREGRQGGQRAVLVRLARRKFGAETAEALAALLEGVSDGGRLDEVADLVVDCASGRDLLAQAAKNDSGSR